MRQQAMSVAGDLSFPALCALIETADLTITNNTGPMHVSAAVKTPVVALFALTNPPEQWGPGTFRTGSSITTSPAASATAASARSATSACAWSHPADGGRFSR